MKKSRFCAEPFCFFYVEPSDRLSTFVWSLEGLSDDPCGGGRGRRVTRGTSKTKASSRGGTIATQHAVLSQIRFWKYGETSKSVLLLLHSSSCVYIHIYRKRGWNKEHRRRREDILGKRQKLRTEHVILTRNRH